MEISVKISDITYTAEPILYIEDVEDLNKKGGIYGKGIVI